MPEPDFQKEVTDFLSSHKRYKPTERNSLLLQEFLEDHDMPFNFESLSTAYTNLAAADKLDLEPEEPPVVSAPRRRFQAFRNGRPL